MAFYNDIIKCEPGRACKRLDCRPSPQAERMEVRTTNLNFRNVIACHSCSTYLTVY